MPGTCGVCGEQRVEQRDADGTYRGACQRCRDAPRETTRHVDTCERESCPVCESHREEVGDE